MEVLLKSGCDSRTVLWPVEMDGTSGRTFVLVQVALPIPPPKEVLIKAGDGVTVEASTFNLHSEFHFDHY